MPLTSYCFADVVLCVHIPWGSCTTMPNESPSPARINIFDPIKWTNRSTEGTHTMSHTTLTPTMILEYVIIVDFNSWQIHRARSVTVTHFGWWEWLLLPACTICAGITIMIHTLAICMSKVNIICFNQTLPTTNTTQRHHNHRNRHQELHMKREPQNKIQNKSWNLNSTACCG